MKIAVYGSLCTGCYNYEKYLKGHVSSCQIGQMKGRLFHLSQRGYPALLEGADVVYCEILTLQGDLDDILTQLNALENFFQPGDPLNEYDRRITEVFNVATQRYEQLPVYWFNMNHRDAKTAEMEYIPAGNWPNYIAQQGRKTHQ